MGSRVVLSSGSVVISGSRIDCDCYLGPGSVVMKNEELKNESRGKVFTLGEQKPLRRFQGAPVAAAL